MKIKRSLEVALVKASTGRTLIIREGDGCFGRNKYGYDSSNPLEQIIAAANAHNPDILVAPEFMFYDRKIILTEDEKKYIEASIAQEVNRKDMLVIPGSIMWHNPKEGGLVKNTSPVITDGKIIAEHMKANNGGCEGIAKEHGLRYAMGPKEGTIFLWKGLDMGLEICSDHKEGMLKNLGKQVDIHIVPASGMLHYTHKNCSREKGYFILCDGFENFRSLVLKRRGAADFEPLQPEKELSGVDIYSIEAEVEE